MHHHHDMVRSGRSMASDMRDRSLLTPDVAEHYVSLCRSSQDSSSNKAGSKKFHFLGEQKKLIRIYAREKKGLGSNWSRTLVDVQSKRGVTLADISISDWTQDELDSLYEYWDVLCPSLEALKERWRTGRKENQGPQTQPGPNASISHLDRVTDILTDLANYSKMLKLPSSSRPGSNKDTGSNDDPALPTAKKSNLPQPQWPPSTASSQASAASRASTAAQYSNPYSGGKETADPPRQQLSQSASLFGGLGLSSHPPSFPFSSTGGGPRSSGLPPSLRVLNSTSELWMDVDGRPLEMPPYWLKGSSSGGGGGLDGNGSSNLPPGASALAQLGIPTGGLGNDIPPSASDSANPFYPSGGAASGQTSLQYPYNKVNQGTAGIFPPYSRRLGLSPPHLPQSGLLDRSPKHQHQQDMYSRLPSSAATGGSKRPLSRVPGHDDPLNLGGGQEPWYKQARTTGGGGGSKASLYSNSPSMAPQAPPYGFPSGPRERYPGAGSPKKYPSDLASQVNYPTAGGGGGGSLSAVEAKLEEDLADEKKVTGVLQAEVERLRQGLGYIEEVLNRSIKTLGQARSSVVSLVSGHGDKKSGGGGGGVQ